jgi:hypothetical protein
MSMKKILMAAVAVSALSAGAANAVNISAANVSNVALTPPSITTGTGTVSYTLASTAVVVDALGAPNANSGTGATTDITATIGGTTVSGVFDPNAGGTNYSATYTLTNAVFSSAVTNASVTLSGNGTLCAPGAVNVVSGGAIGTSSVTAVFNIPNTCSSAAGTTLAPNAVTFVAPFKVLSAGSVTGTVGFKVVATDTAFDVRGVTGGAITLVRTQAPYVTKITADTVATTLGLASGLSPVYSYLKSGAGFDSVLGKIDVDLAAPSAAAAGGLINATMDGGVRPAITYDLTVTATAGNFAVVKPGLGVNTTTGTAIALATPTAGTATQLGNAAGYGTVTAAISAANTTSLTAAQTYSATITPALATNTVVTTPAAVTAALQTIGLDGVSFLAPWIGGSQSSSSSYIRVSNSGTATGQVTMSLLSPTGAASAPTVCTSTTLSKLSSIAANGELVINPTDLTTCFGDFTRGDVSVTIQSTSTGLTAKARNVTPTSVSELSLGAGTFN